MIERDKPQNIIIAAMIVIAVISSVYLYSNASYYSGSYVIINELHIDLIDVQVLNYENMSLNPALRMVFNVKAPDVATGSATLTYLRAVVYLNNESLSYTEFRLSIPPEKQAIIPGYNENFTIGSTITVDEDKAIIYDAAANDNWIFKIELTYFYHIFKATAESVNFVAFAWQKTD